jgi:hypothetical protein
MIVYGIRQVIQEMGNVFVGSDDVVKVDASAIIRVWRDPYGVATERLHDLQSYREFQRDYGKLECKEKLDLVSKIVENKFI